VERAIDELVDRYIAHPLGHRVEHSLHAELFQILISNPDLGQLYQLGRTGYWSRVVHKEWPETRPRPQKGSRRGNFDIAVLSPAQLEQVGDVDQFTQGSIAAPIVVELGLGYGGVHLAGDDEKLVNSEVQHPFLVHFSHVRSKLHEATESAIVTAAARMQVAYVLHDLSTRQFRVKRRTDQHISGPHDTAPRSALALM
jgi:hypothetical protein